MNNTRRIKVTDIVAIDSTQQAKRILAMNGLSPARSIDDLKNKLNQLLRMNDEAILTQIADSHPDKDFILNYSSDVKSNATGKDNDSDLNSNGHGKTCRCRNCQPYVTPYYAWGSSQELADDYMMGVDGSPVPMMLNRNKESNQKTGAMENIGMLGVGIIALGFVTVVALATRK